MSDIPRKSVETFSFRLLNQAFAVLTSILLARTLGPHGKGIFTYVTSVMSVLLTVSAGQSAAISWQYGRLKRSSGEVLSVMVLVLGYAGVAMALLIAVVALTVPSQRTLVAVAVALPFSFLSQMALGFFLADGNVRVCNIQLLISSGGFLLALVPALLVFNLGLTAVLAIWVAAAIVTALYSVLKLRSYATGSYGTRPDLLREQIVFGIKVTANALVALLNFRIDVFIILFILGANALGVYSIAIGFGELMWQLSRPLAFSAFGTITSASKAEAAMLTAKCVRHTLAMVSVGCLVLFFVGPTLITLVYGRAFTGAGAALRFLLPGIIAYSMTPFLSGYFTQQLGKPTIQLLISTSSTLLCAVITFATVRLWGIVGGAFATSVSYIVAYLVSVFLFKKETGIPVGALFTFGQDDIRPYRVLLASIWNRATALVAGTRR